MKILNKNKEYNAADIENGSSSSSNNNRQQKDGVVKSSEEKDEEENSIVISHDSEDTTTTTNIGKKEKTKKKKETKKKNNNNNNKEDNNSNGEDENDSTDKEENEDNNQKNDYHKTSVLDFKRLFQPWEWIVTCDHYPTWREHLSWSKDGSDLRHYVTARMSSNMVVLTLLLSALISFLFDSGDIPSNVRDSLYKSKYDTLAYYIGIEVLISIFVTLYAILSTFTAWGMVMAIDESNVTPLLRSPMGQYTIELTTRLVLLSLLFFLLWCTLLVIYLVNYITTIIFVTISALYYFHVVSTYSAFGRTILYSGAMQNKPLFDESELDELMPKELHQNLIQKCEEQKSKRQSPAMQYKKGHLRRWWNAIFRGKDSKGNNNNNPQNKSNGNNNDNNENQNNNQQQQHQEQEQEDNNDENDNNKNSSLISSWFSSNNKEEKEKDEEEEEEEPPDDREEMENDLKHSPEAKDANFENKNDVEKEATKMRNNKTKQKENEKETKKNKQEEEEEDTKNQRRRTSSSSSIQSLSDTKKHEKKEDNDNESLSSSSPSSSSSNSSHRSNNKDTTGNDTNDKQNGRNTVDACEGNVSNSNTINQRSSNSSSSNNNNNDHNSNNDNNNNNNNTSSATTTSNIQTIIKDGIQATTEMIQSNFGYTNNSGTWNERYIKPGDNDDIQKEHDCVDIDNDEEKGLSIT